MATSSSWHGTLYFIGEKDLVSKEVSSYVKVGVVIGERDVESRAKEHQTGNPRELNIVESIESPFVQKLETHLKKEFVQLKVSSGEWLWLGSASLGALLSRARALNEQLVENQEAIRFALDAKLPGSLPPLELDDAIRAMGLRRAELADQIRFLRVETKKIFDEQQTVLSRLRERESPDAMPLPKRKYEEKASFSAQLLKKERPDWHAAFSVTTTSIQANFLTMTTTVSSEETLALFGLIPFDNLDTKSLPDEVAQNVLQDTRLAYESQISILEWEKNLLESQLLFIGRQHRGIEAVLSWKESSSTRFDKDRFLAEMPEEAQDFFVVKKARVLEQLPQFGVSH